MPHLHSCCISHLFYSAATKTPTQIAVIHAAATNRSLISSSPPIYEGDDCFTNGDIISAVDSFSRRIRRVLNGGDDPDLIRPQGYVHNNERVSNLDVADNDMQSPQGYTYGISSFSGNPRVVGVHIAPSVEYVVAVLSILRCGEAFLPLDPLWPEERIMSVVSSSRTSLVIGCPPISSMCGTSRSDAVDWSVSKSGCSVLHLSMKVGLSDQFMQSDLVWPCECRSPRQFSYLMYTSGSTGKPKGVCGTETGLLNRFWWMQDQFPLSKEDVLLFKTSISFVDHLQEFLSAILTSTTLLVPLFDKFKANPLYIVDLIKAYGISRLTSVPSLMRAIVPFGTSEWMPIRMSLKVLILSGEILSISLWKTLHELLPETAILNLYGSTEVSGDCTYFDCKNLSNILDVESLNSVPIGLPISNCEVEIVGETYKPDEGEIYVGGACLFMGYFGEPFCGHSIKDNGTSLYFRTGDFAKRLQGGHLVFIGRKDRTIKLNGQRVALEEIENAIREHPEVSDAAVIFQKVHGALPELQAYFVMKTTQKRRMPDIDKLPVEELIASIKSWLMRKLPLAMIPTHYICTDLLPTSASGKIDYAMLSSSISVPKLPKVEYGKTLTFEDHLQVIKKAFCDALLVEEFSVDDDFFIMGGNSISSAHAAHKLGIDMRLLYVFSTPFKLLNGLLDQRGSHEIVSSGNPVPLKKVKVIDDKSTSSDSSNNLQDNNLIRRSLHAINEEGNLNLCMQLNAKQTNSLTEKDDGSSFSLGPLPSAQYGAVSISDHGDLWISNLGFPLECSFTRCNQIMVCGETELSKEHQARLLIKVSGSTKGRVQELWKVPLKSCVDASPLVVYKNGSISLFIGSHSHIFQCIDAFSGCVRWEVKLEGRVECSAAITGDFSQVVVGCYKGKIYFLDYWTGNTLWEFQTGGEIKMQPVVDKYRKLIWCGSHDHCLYALDYSSHCCAHKISCGGSIYGSPSIDTVHNMIYVASTSGRVCGISTEALLFKIIWSYESGAPIFGSVSMAPSSRNVICCLVDGRVLALSSRGDVIWKVTVGGPIFAGACISSALPSQALICSRDGSVYSLDMERGDILWEYNIHDPITASAYVDDRSLLETESSDPCDRLACVCSSSGRIHVLRINSNAKQERLLHGGAVPQSQMVKEFAVMDLQGEIFSSPVMIGGRIFVGCRDDYVHCVNLVN